MPTPRLTRFLAGFAVSLLVLAPTASLRAAPSAEVTVVAEVPIVFEARGQKLPVPLVPGRIQEQEGLLLIDTGSSHNALTRTFADACGLVRNPAGTGRDHAGDAVKTELASATEWRLGTFTRPVEETLVVPGPPPFAPLGIVGFLSPQRFFAGSTVVLDFPGGRLFALSGSSAAIEHWLAERYRGAARATLPRVAGPHADKLYVTAQLAGGGSAVAEIDTGGTTTEFAESLLPPAEAAPETATSTAVGGRTRTARVVPGQTLALGSLDFGPTKVKARPAGGSPEVLVGIDLLRLTVLVIPAEPAAPLVVLRSGGR